MPSPTAVNRGHPVVRLGIVSDTHGLLRPELLSALDGVDAILHAGDIGDPDILLALEALAPTTAVWGNTDGFAMRQQVPEIARVTLSGVRIVVLHGHQFGRAPTPSQLRAAFPDTDLVVYGHTHVPVIERLEGCTFVNPGSAGPERTGLPVTCAHGTLDLLEIEVSLTSLRKDR